MTDAEKLLAKAAESTPEDPIATIVINCHTNSGRLEVAGHIYNKFLCLQMLINAGQQIMNLPPPTNGVPPN